MDTRSIGSLEVSVVGLGCNQFGRNLDLEGSRPVIEAAIDAGITLLDTSDTYGPMLSEEFLGEIIGSRRSGLVIATKFGKDMPGGKTGAHPDYIREAVEGSLSRLKTDYIDLYQIHAYDPNTPLADTMAVLNELIDEGKVREIGCSNFSVAQLSESEAIEVGHHFASLQNEYSMLQRQPDFGVLEACRNYGLAFLPYFPLAAGLLTGKYSRSETGRLSANTALATVLKTEENLALVDALTLFAEDRGHTILELAFAWLLARRPVASVIAGATSPAQVVTNSSAAQWTLSEADLDEIDRIAPARDIPASLD